EPESALGTIKSITAQAFPAEVKQESED
ncbi:hypothetical protein HMPREF1033_00951, partial [Tannerella sp. 6_1_58FAA_CT1]